jgi:hypothetical protein
VSGPNAEDPSIVDSLRPVDRVLYALTDVDAARMCGYLAGHDERLFLHIARHIGVDVGDVPGLVEAARAAYDALPIGDHPEGSAS